MKVPRNGKIRLANGAKLKFFDVNPKNFSVMTWAPSNGTSFDFRCGSSWAVNGTGANPSFRVPCYMDVVDFPDVRSLLFRFVYCLMFCNSLQGETFMTVVAENTFIQKLNLPFSNNLTGDPYQYAGWPLGYSPSQCPQLYSSNKGLSYCAKVCLNTCPEQHPNHLDGLKLQIAQNQTLLEFLTPAIQEAKAAQEIDNSLLHAVGSVSFPIPATASSGAVKKVQSKITTLLKPSYPVALNVTV